MTSEVEGLAAAVERFEAFLRVNRLVGEGLVRNGQILSWRDFDALLAALRAQAERVRVLETAADRLVEATCPIGTAPSEAQLIELSDAALAVAALLAAAGRRALENSDEH